MVSGWLKFPQKMKLNRMQLATARDDAFATHKAAWEVKLWLPIYDYVIDLQPFADEMDRRKLLIQLRVLS
jgi:hypothetical protein